MVGMQNAAFLALKCKKGRLKFASKSVALIALFRFIEFKPWISLHQKLLLNRDFKFYCWVDLQCLHYVLPQLEFMA